MNSILLTPNYAELVFALRPEIALTVGMLIVLAYDLAIGRRANYSTRRAVAVAIGFVALVSASLQTIAGNTAVPALLFHGMFVSDSLSYVTRLGVFALSALALLLFAGAKHERNPAEYVAIQILATIGFSLMAASNNLLVAFLGLELASLSLYVAAGFDKTNRDSAEAGLKYFLFGGMAAAFMLFGFSLLYGLTGTLMLQEMAPALAVQGSSPLLLVALVMVLVGFGYKSAAAPFHLWAPDVYQGAPAPAAALIASASKLAGFALFARILFAGLNPVSGNPASFGDAPGWMTVIVIISAASLLLGNIVALVQTNVRRLFAYSAIAHAGAMLIGVIAVRAGGPGPLVYYAFTYGLATTGVFGVFAVVERVSPCQKTSDLTGLWKRSPFLAAVLFVCVLSLAGIPPLAGFFGKFCVFANALSNGFGGAVGWLTLLGILISAVGLYYYIIVLKYALVANAGAENAEKIRTPPAMTVALAVIALLIIVLGICPSMILNAFK